MVLLLNRGLSKRHSVVTEWLMCILTAQSYSMTTARSVHEPIIEPTAKADSATDLESLTPICRWTSKRISAVEGSHLVLARYSQKSSTASQDDEAAGLPLNCIIRNPHILIRRDAGRVDMMIPFD